MDCHTSGFHQDEGRKFPSHVKPSVIGAWNEILLIRCREGNMTKCWFMTCWDKNVLKHVLISMLTYSTRLSKVLSQLDPVTEQQKAANNKAMSRTHSFFSTMFIFWGVVVISWCWGVKVTLTVYPSHCARHHSTFPLPAQSTVALRRCQPATSVTPGEAVLACRLSLPSSHLTQTTPLPAPPYVLPSTVIHGGQRWDVPSGIILAECSTPSGNCTCSDTFPGVVLYFDSGGIYMWKCWLTVCIFSGFITPISLQNRLIFWLLYSCDMDQVCLQQVPLNACQGQLLINSVFLLLPPFTHTLIR